MTKAELRQSLREARNQLGPAARSAASQAIVEHLRGLPDLLAAQRVGVFWPLSREVDLRPLFVGADACGFALPVVTGTDAPLTFREATGPLEPGPFGVHAPTAAAAEVPLAQLDLLLMPALGVDGRGHRLGYGGGYYDRTLALCPSVQRLAVVFHCQVLQTVPVEPHDVPLHGYVTERGVFRALDSTAL